MDLKAVSNYPGTPVCRAVLVRGLRWLHASLVGNELAELKSDPSVVGSLGNQSYDYVSIRFSVKYPAALRFAAKCLSRSVHANMDALDKPCRAIRTSQCTPHFTVPLLAITRNPRIAD
jgi:hypothetical protein